MPTSIEFYFDFVSSYSYLAATQLASLRDHTGAEIVYRPFRLLELMKLVGNRPTTVECSNKNNYARADLARWAARYDVPFQRNPNLRDFDHDALRRAALVAIGQGQGEAVELAMFRALWAGKAHFAEPAALAGVLGKAGLDGAGVIEQSKAPEYERRLEASRREAAERGVFGSPTFFVGDQMFFGNDRLDFVTAALKQAA